jgi:hypothetical protein
MYDFVVNFVTNLYARYLYYTLETSHVYSFNIHGFVHRSMTQ